MIPVGLAEARVSRTHRCPKGRPPVLKTGRITGSQALPRKMNFRFSASVSMTNPAPPDSTTADAGTATSVRLTQQVKAGGCASKLAPGVLNQVLADLPRQQDENLL